MKIYVELENNKVKSYQIGQPSSICNIEVPSEHSLNDLEALIAEMQDQEVDKLDEMGNPILDENSQPVKETVQVRVWSIDQEVIASKQLSMQESKLNQIREIRNSLLAACDFTQLVDAPISSEKKEAYRLYRQALRDLPGSIVDINNFEWPG